jgi:hypothetical protein
LNAELDIGKVYIFFEIVRKSTNGGGGYKLCIGEGGRKYSGTYPKTALFYKINMVIYKKI